MTAAPTAPSHKHTCLRCKREFDCLTPGLCTAVAKVLPNLVIQHQGEIRVIPHCLPEYKGYIPKVEFDKGSGILHGEVVGIRDVVTFQGHDVTDIEKAFHDSVDDYLAMCAERGEEPCQRGGQPMSDHNCVAPCKICGWGIATDGTEIQPLLEGDLAVAINGAKAFVEELRSAAPTAPSTEYEHMARQKAEMLARSPEQVELRALRREVETWRWLHWDHAGASWACPCGNANSASIERCDECGAEQPRPTAPVEQEGGEFGDAIKALELSAAKVVLGAVALFPPQEPLSNKKASEIEGIAKNCLSFPVDFHTAARQRVLELYEKVEADRDEWEGLAGALRGYRDELMAEIAALREDAAILELAGQIMDFSSVDWESAKAEARRRIASLSTSTATGAER